MPKKTLTKIKAHDAEAFSNAIKGVKRLQQNKIRLKPPILVKKKRSLSVTPEELEDMELAEKLELREVGGEEYISYRHASISHKTLRKLRKGQYNVEATLDLHGFSVNKAEIALKEFLCESLQQEHRVVVVIHGKGKQRLPILKNKLNHWLRTVKDILAFCSASSAHGRHGAVYILLKKRST